MNTAPERFTSAFVSSEVRLAAWKATKITSAFL